MSSPVAEIRLQAAERHGLEVERKAKVADNINAKSLRLFQLYGVATKMSSPEEAPPAAVTASVQPIVMAVCGIAVLLCLATFGLALWLDQGEALFVRLAADAWASCF